MRTTCQRTWRRTWPFGARMGGARPPHHELELELIQPHMAQKPMLRTTPTPPPPSSFRSSRLAEMGAQLASSVAFGSRAVGKRFRGSPLRSFLYTEASAAYVSCQNSDSAELRTPRARRARVALITGQPTTNTTTASPTTLRPASHHLCRDCHGLRSSELCGGSSISATAVSMKF